MFFKLFRTHIVISIFILLLLKPAFTSHYFIVLLYTLIILCFSAYLGFNSNLLWKFKQRYNTVSDGEGKQSSPWNLQTPSEFLSSQMERKRGRWFCRWIQDLADFKPEKQLLCWTADFFLQFVTHSWFQNLLSNGRSQKNYNWTWGWLMERCQSTKITFCWVS